MSTHVHLDTENETQVKSFADNHTDQNLNLDLLSSSLQAWSTARGFQTAPWDPQGAMKLLSGFPREEKGHQTGLLWAPISIPTRASTTYNDI